MVDRATSILACILSVPIPCSSLLVPPTILRYHSFLHENYFGSTFVACSACFLGKMALKISYSANLYLLRTKTFLQCTHYDSIIHSEPMGTPVQVPSEKVLIITSKITQLNFKEVTAAAIVNFLDKNGF